jgi:hypothetical protein
VGWGNVRIYVLGRKNKHLQRLGNEKEKQERRAPT